MVGLLFSLLFEEVRKIWCYRWMLAATSAAVFAAGAAYIVSLPDTYESWAQMFVPKRTPLSEATEDVSLVSKDFGNPYVIQRTLLNDASLAKIITELSPETAPKDPRKMESAAGALRSRIDLDFGEDGFIEFRVRDTDPVRAQKTTQLLLDRFIAESVERNVRDLAIASSFLDEKIAEYEKLLLDSQERITALQTRYPQLAMVVVAPSPDTAGELASARAAYAAARSAASGTQRPVSAPQDQAIADLENRLASLLTQYTEQYPDVVAARRQLAVLQAQRAQYLATAPAPTPAADPAVAAASGRLAAAQARARSTAVRGVPAEISAQWAELQRNHELLSSTHKELIGEREGAKIAEAIYGSPTAKYQVTRAPTTPVAPSGPNRSLLLALAAVAALVIGVGVAYARAAVAGIFVSPRSLEEAFQLPVIGTVSWEPAWHVKRTKHTRKALGHTKTPALPAS